MSPQVFFLSGADCHPDDESIVVTIGEEYGWQDSGKRPAELLQPFSAPNGISGFKSFRNVNTPEDYYQLRAEYASVGQKGPGSDGIVRIKRSREVENLEY